MYFSWVVAGLRQGWAVVARYAAQTTAAMRS